jgi:hypothetical protein
MTGTTARELKLIVEARVAGLSEQYALIVATHAGDRPSDAARAFALAETSQALSASPATLAVALEHGVSVDKLLIAASRLVNVTRRLTRRKDAALRRDLGG